MHTAYAVETFVGLLLGQFLSAWAIADASVNSKLNGITSYSEYLHKNSRIVLTRLAIAWGLFSLYALNGPALCAEFGDIVPGLTWIAAHPIPVNPATALLYGLNFDLVQHALYGFLARWIPALRKEVPPATDSQGVDIPKKDGV